MQRMTSQKNLLLRRGGTRTCLPSRNDWTRSCNEAVEVGTVPAVSFIRYVLKLGMKACYLIL